MPYFLVHTVVTIPEGESDRELVWLRAAEVSRAQELQDTGILAALWREAGRLASYGLWHVSDATQLRQLVATLPMYRYMTVELIELEPHPNAVGTFPFPKVRP